MVLIPILFTLLVPVQDSESTVPPSASDVIDRYIEAKGGRKSLEQIENYVVKGIWTSEGKTTCEYETYQAKNLHLSIVTYPNGSQRQHGTNGKIAWRIDVEGNAMILRGEAEQDYLRHASSLHKALAWTEEVENIEYVQRTSIGETSAHQLRFPTHDGTELNRFFDAESGLLVREEVRLTDINKTLLVSEITDYVKEPDDTMVARLRIIHRGPREVVEDRVTSYEANNIDDLSIFDLPEEIVKLQAKLENN